MAHKEVLWQVPAAEFQKFDHGALITDDVLAEWDLKVGDTLEYEIGCNISGIAEVVSLSAEAVRVYDWDNVIDDINDEPDMVPGIRCTFRKVN